MATNKPDPNEDQELQPPAPPIGTEDPPDAPPLAPPIGVDAPLESDRYTPVHVGHGRHQVAGKEFPTLERAEEYAEDLRLSDRVREHFGPKKVGPAGLMGVSEATWIFRDNLLELPMNEMYAPDGSYNPFFDKDWMWGWASLAKGGHDISLRRAEGWQLVSLEEFQNLAKAERIPTHYENFVREEGSYLVFGDLVLMRILRALHHQLRLQREALNRQLAQVGDADSALLHANAQADYLPFKSERVIGV